MSLLPFLQSQQFSPEPILHPKWFRNAAFTVVNVTNVMVNMVGFAVMFLVPFYLDRMTGLSLVTAGVVLATAAVPKSDSRGKIQVR